MMAGLEQRAGVTIIEAVAVLVIVGILVAVAVPRLAGVDSGLDTEAEILRSHLRYAQSMAMANNVAVWEVSIAAASYSLLKDNVPVNLPGENSSSHVFAGNARAAAQAPFVVDDLGSPGQTDKTITLSDTGGRTLAVVMLGGTGFIQ